MLHELDSWLSAESVPADAIQQAAVVAIQAAGGPTIAITPGKLLQNSLACLLCTLCLQQPHYHTVHGTGRQDSWAFPPPGRLFAPIPGAAHILLRGDSSW